MIFVFICDLGYCSNLSQSFGSHPTLSDRNISNYCQNTLRLKRKTKLTTWPNMSQNSQKQIQTFLPWKHIVAEFKQNKSKIPDSKSSVWNKYFDPWKYHINTFYKGVSPPSQPVMKWMKAAFSISMVFLL